MLRTLATLGLVLAASTATATVTFDGHSGSEGFSYHNSDVHAVPGVVYLHDDGGISRSAIRRTSRDPFSIAAIDVFADSRINVSGDGPAPEYSSPDYSAWANSAVLNDPIFKVVAFRDRVVSGVMKFSATDGWNTLRLGAGFQNIDKLVAKLSVPGGTETYTFGEPSGPNQAWCDEWCADFQIDNLVMSAPAAASSETAVTAVPVPASALMTLSGMVLLVGAARARRRTA